MTNETVVTPVSFDRNRELDLCLSSMPDPFPVRFPTDQEWIEHQKSIRILQRSMGRKIFTDRVNGSRADVVLIERVRVEPGKPITPKDAGVMVEVLTRYRTHKYFLGPESFEFSMEFLNLFQGHHILKLPSPEQYKAMAINHRSAWKAKGVSEVICQWEKFADLYDELVSSVEGYSNGVPVLHKITVLCSLKTALLEVS